MNSQTPPEAPSGAGAPPPDFEDEADKGRRSSALRAVICGIRFVDSPGFALPFEFLIGNGERLIEQVAFCAASLIGLGLFATAEKGREPPTADELCGAGGQAGLLLRRLWREVAEYRESWTWSQEEEDLSMLRLRHLLEQTVEVRNEVTGRKKPS